MSEQPLVDVEVCAAKVFTIARALFCLSTEFDERAMAYRLALAEDPDRLNDLQGKYLKMDAYRSDGDFYIHLRPNGNGLALHRLPDGVPPDDVIEDPFDVSGARPLQERLEAILLTLPSDDPNAAALAIAISRILGACAPDHVEKIFAEVKRRGTNTVLEPAAESGGANIPQDARRFLEELGELAATLRGEPTGDGETVASLLLMRDLSLALASGWGQNSDEEILSIAASVKYIAAPTPFSMRDVAQSLCQRAVAQEQEPTVREVAENLKSHGDRLIEQALDSGLDSFYPTLYEATGYEIAAFFAAEAAASVSEDPIARKRWLKLATNAEETMTRIATSLQFAVVNLDGDFAARDALWVREKVEKDGKRAARLAATNLIINELRYPRSALPILLGESDPI